MIYVFDNSPLSHLFKGFYRARFPSLWTKFDAFVASGRLTSTREVQREIEDSSISSLVDWCANNKAVFTVPGSEEGAFVARIYGVAHFRQNIEQRKLLKGGRCADPFIIAKAAAVNGTVVTLEQEKTGGSKIPNICKHFGVPCASLEQFMEAENWQF